VEGSPPGRTSAMSPSSSSSLSSRVNTAVSSLLIFSLPSVSNRMFTNGVCKSIPSTSLLLSIKLASNKVAFVASPSIKLRISRSGLNPLGGDSKILVTFNFPLKETSFFNTLMNVVPMAISSSRRISGGCACTTGRSPSVPKRGRMDGTRGCFIISLSLYLSRVWRVLMYSISYSFIL